MGRTGKQIWDVQREFSDDFTVINDALLLCKFCDTIVKWRKKTRVHEHLQTRMHVERKGAKKTLLFQPPDSEDDMEEEDKLASSLMRDNNTMGGGESAVDGQQYCLRWNHHQSNMLKVFSRLLGNEQFTDVLLATEGKTIRCHKVVLSACSTYFENLFLSFDEKNQIVILKDTTFEDISAIVEFMYKGEINVAQSQLASLLRTAENLKVKGLAEVSSGEEAAMTSLEPSASKATQVLKPSCSPPPVSTSNNTPVSTQPIIRLPQVPIAKSSTSKQTSDMPQMKRKRGRPRILDTPGEVNPCFATPRLVDGISGLGGDLSPLQHALATTSSGSTADTVTSTNQSSMPFGGGGGQHDLDFGPDFGVANEPTPGGPLTEERIKSLGVVKMNDYLTAGTRQQFWEEYYVKVIMQAVRNKEIDMKGGAEILGVSYGTLYGRYRETFGYVKHAWNVGGRPHKTPLYPSFSSHIASLIDGSSLHVLEQLKLGKINIRQAAELLNVEPALLAYQLAAKTKLDEDMMDMVEHEEEDDEDEEEEDEHNDQQQLMEVQPDVVINDDEERSNDDYDDDNNTSSCHNTVEDAAKHRIKLEEERDPIATS